MYYFFTRYPYFSKRGVCKLLVMMKLVSMFLLGTMLHVSASTLGQKISLRVKQATLQEILQDIQVQTNFDFLYSESEFRSFGKVDVSFNNKDLQFVLQKILTPQGLVYFLDNQMVLIKSRDELLAQMAQNQQVIEGYVKDEQGHPISGASISLQNSNLATATDSQGYFKLVSPDAAPRIIVSALGYESQTIPISSTKSLQIVLKEAISDLDEVIVVGYGQQKRANLTGAVSQVNASDIALRPDANIASTLQGLMPGLNIQMNDGDPAATPDINVRGFNSINGGSPLILIDGIEGNITRVNPNDIESVTVLKDASSASIYGARGAFGVILITTKTGKAGTTSISYTNNFGWTSPTARTDYISDPYVYGKTVDAALYGYNGSSYTNYNDEDWEKIKKVASGELAPFHELQADGTNKFFYKSNWWDHLFKKNQGSNFHNIAISGGSDKLKGYLSGRLFKRESINNINDDANMDRQNLKANVVFTPYKWLELSNNVQFINEKDKDYGGYANGFGGLWSTTTWYHLMAFYPIMVDGIPTDIGTGTGGQGGSAGLYSGKTWRLYDTDELTNTFRAVVKPIEGLQVNFDYSHRLEYTAQNFRLNPFEHYSGNRLKLTTKGLNRLSEFRWKDKYDALNLFATYTKSLNQYGNIKVLAGFNQEFFDRDRVAATVDGLLIEDLANLSLGTVMNNINGSATNWAVQGYFGRLNYDYDNKYLLELNARYDGSSRFPKESRWGLFPSISAGWQIDRESFWQPLKPYVSSFKVRGSFGKLGNQTVGVNTFKELMNVGVSNWLDGGTKLNFASMPGPLPTVVTWESTETVNVGADLGFLGNKLFVNADWFRKNVQGMYLPGEPLPAVFGANEPKENYAGLRNEGFEIGLSYQDKFEVAGAPLHFSATASLSNFKGTITRYNNPNGLLSSYYEGQELGEIWGYHIDGQFKTDEEALAYQNSFTNPRNNLSLVYNDILNVMQNSEWNHLRAGDVKYIDVNKDGRIDKGDNTLEKHGDLSRIGNSMPQFPFGLNLNMRWKAFDMALAVAGVAHQDWYPTGDLYWGSYQRPYLSFLRKDLVDQAWTADKPNNPYPQIYRGYSSLQGGRSLNELNDYYLTNVGYLRLRNFTFGYTLPQSLTQRVKVDKLRLFFSGENILTWSFGNLTKYLDPEQAGSAVNYSSPETVDDRGDLRSYPMGKTISFGVMLTL